VATFVRTTFLTLTLVVAGCGPPDPDRPAAAGCGAVGRPVTIATLVRIFRANGITLDVNRRRCERPDSTSPHATNAGPSGLERVEEIDRSEGSVLCHVGRTVITRTVKVVKYRTDEETHLTVLNVQCAAYPYDAASEREQVARVESAMRALLGSRGAR
jgi:hypothetical protein